MRTAARKPETATDDVRALRRRRRRLRRLAAVAVAAAVLAVLVTAPLLAARDARAALLAGQAHLQEARDAVAEARLDAARQAFAAAGRHIDEGQASLDSRALRWADALPMVGDNLAAARSLAQAGEHAAAAGVTATGAVAALPGGLAALAPRDGAMPLNPLLGLVAPLDEAAGEIAAAEEVLAAAPDRGLAAPLERARDEATDQVAEGRETLETGRALAGALPSLLGADGPRRYFLGAQNPAELRGTGGLIGAFGILTADGGRIDVSDFRNISELTRAAPPELPPPSEDYAARYARYSAGVHGSNVNMTPDVPTAARAIETLYTATTGEPVDGTILADPLLLQALLEVIGPTDVPGIGTVDAGGVVQFVTQDQYAVLAGPSDERKEALGEIAAVVLRRFLTEAPGDPLAALRTLGAAAADGHLRVHARDDDVQAALAAAGVDGALADADGDYVGVFGNNAAGTKADAFLEREVAYDVALEPDGSASGLVTVTLTNTAPTEGLHPTVIGPYVDELGAGENRTLWSVYCAPGCSLTAFRRDAEPELIATEHERGRPVFTTTVQLSSGQSQVLEFEWTVADAWRPEVGGGTYRLDVDTQPALEPTPVRVRVQAPDDAVFVATDPAAEVGRRRVVWTADSPAASIEVALAPRGGGVAERIRDLLNRPLFTVGTSS